MPASSRRSPDRRRDRPRLAHRAAGAAEGGATLFDVEIELDPASNVTLRAGYSANADLIIREKKDILTIPERLVTFETAGRRPSSRCRGATAKAEPKKTPVKLGISDGLNVEVLEGAEGGGQGRPEAPKEIT